MHSAEFRRCLVECDVAGIRALWSHVSPNMPQPPDDAAALIAIHIARTQAESVPLKLRAYSHRWLLDNGYPSQLPDNLKPSAERIYPRIASAVGVCVKAGSEWRKPLAAAMQQAMSDAVAEAYADGRTEPEFVKARMGEARAKVLRVA
jgi:hypothetical protein